MRYSAGEGENPAQAGFLVAVMGRPRSSAKTSFRRGAGRPPAGGAFPQEGACRPSRRRPTGAVSCETAALAGRLLLHPEDRRRGGAVGEGRLIVGVQSLLGQRARV